MSNLPKPKVMNNFKKETMRPLEDGQQLAYMAQQAQLYPEYIIVTVIPCGREDGKNSDDEKPYEHKIRKKRKQPLNPYEF